MIRAGFVIENPRTLSRTVVLEGDAETQSLGWLLEVTARPGAGPDITEHLHLTWTESFEIVEGTAHYKLDGVQHTAETGAQITLPPGRRHVHPWNAGDGPLVYRQRSDFGAPDPVAVQDVLGAFATLAGLARAGKVDKRGLPSNPLQLAATMQTLVKHGGYDAALPITAQNILAATLGRIAVLLGYRGVDPQYVS